MSEGPTDGLARRGKRQPSIAQAIQEEVELQEESDEPAVLYPGARLEAKLSSNFSFGGRDTYVTIGAEDRLQPGETDEDLYVRVGSTALARLIDLAYEAEEKITEAQRAFDSRPIRPRN